MDTASSIGKFSHFFRTLRDEYLRHALTGDRRAAVTFVQRALDDGVPALDLVDHVVRASQHDIGRLWQEDRISIAQEHMATAISQLVLAHLFQHAQFRERVGRKILVACVPGELHDFPARMLADSLDVDGYDIRFLGADVPLPDLLASIEHEKPDVLALSVTMVFNLPSLRSTLAAVRARFASLPIVVGGYACTRDPDVGADERTRVVKGGGPDFVRQLESMFAVAA
jgi:MerR family transcriptional regulator, light-induced transcriptional regulator